MSRYDSPSRSNVGPSRSLSVTRHHHPYERESSPSILPRFSQDSPAPERRSNFTRGIAASASTSSLTRSGSEGFFSRLWDKAFGSTPKKLAGKAQAHHTEPHNALKRDIRDAEQGSPTDNRKRQRRRSPSPFDGQNGDYAPLQITGRAVTGSMIRPDNGIPALPANFTFGAKGKSSTTNFSRPLTNSKSMPYLDPDAAMLSPSRGKRSGMLTRSRRLDLSSEVGDEETSQQIQEENEFGQWVGGRSRTIGSPARRTPTRQTPSRDFAITNSPFKIPESPSRARNISGNSLARSTTIGNLARAPSLAPTDVSMGAASSNGFRRSGSVLFGGSQRGSLLNGDDKMSVDGGREGSVTDWFMRERFSNSVQPQLSPARSVRNSLTPSASLMPIRRGPMVFAGEKGFVRESDLEPQPTATGSNEAERILFALENRRTTPLKPARSNLSFAQGGPFPADLVGASTRQIRKAINVPLATAPRPESSRQQREKELQEERSRGVSVLISPYGRRKQADDAVRQVRRESRVDSDYRPSSERELSVDAPSSRISHRSRSSHGTDHSMRSESEAEAPTPRRSSRLRKTDATPEPESTPKARSKGKGKAKESSRKNRSSAQPDDTPRRSTRRPTVERDTSPTPPRNAPSIPTITETAPSPQQSKDVDMRQSGSTYQPRAEGLSRGTSSLRAGAEKTNRTHQASANNSRANTPGSGRFSANDDDLPDMDSLAQAKIPLTSFSGFTFSGMSSGTSTPVAQPGKTDAAPATGLGVGLNPPAPSEAPKIASPRVVGGQLSKLQSSRPRASSPLASGSIVAEPESPPATKTQETAKIASAPMPQPNSDGFIPLSAAGSGSNTPLDKPTSSLFGGISTAPPASSTLFSGLGNDASKKMPGLGIGKPSSVPEKAPEITNGGVPNFFGARASQPTSGATTPVAAPKPAFDFGVNAPTPSSTPAVPVAPSKIDSPASFSFGVTPKPAEQPTSTFEFGAKSAERTSSTSAAKPTFNFGTQPTESAPTVPKSSFSFGKPAETTQSPAVEQSGFNFSASKPASSASTSQTTNGAPEPPKSTFSFGNPVAPSAPTPAPAADKPAEPSKFSFGAPSAASPAAPANKPAGGFTFGQASSSQPEVPKPASNFSFGTSSTGTSNPFQFGAPATAANGDAAPKPTSFGFGQSSSSAPAPAPAANGFSFSQPPTNTGTVPTSTFTFGSSSSNAPKRSAEESAEQPPPKYAVMDPTPNTSTTSFSFGAAKPAAPSAPGGGFTFGAPANNAAPASNPFGGAPTMNYGSAPSTPTTPVGNPFGSNPAPGPPGPSGGPSFDFKFGGSNPAPGPSQPFQFGGPTNNAPQFGANPAPSGFGASAPANPPSTFAFGAPSNGPAPSFGGFGNTNNTNGGAPAMRFGTPPVEGGFSLGAASAMPPGSPGGGGRQIKPLRRAKR